MKVDFYQLSRDPAELVLPMIARKVMADGERLLVVSADADQLDRIDRALWERLPDSFLAHDRAGADHAARQPIPLSDSPDPANGARHLAITDGVWREGATPFERTFHMFGPDTIVAARDWVNRYFNRQDEVSLSFTGSLEELLRTPVALKDAQISASLQSVRSAREMR